MHVKLLFTFNWAHDSAGDIFHSTHFKLLHFSFQHELGLKNLKMKEKKAKANILVLDFPR